LATYDGIAAVSRAMIGLLEDARDTFAHQSSALGFKLYHASDFDAPMADHALAGGFGISLCLYRVAINGSMRNAPRKVEPDGKSYRAPLPLDLYYLLTAWANDVEMEQRLLGWAMRTLHDTPVLPAALINEHTPGSPAFGPSETVEITLDTLSFQDMATIWDKLKPKMQTSVFYIARMVLIESTRALVQAGPVQTRVFGTLEGASAVR